MSQNPSFFRRKRAAARAEMLQAWRVFLRDGPPKVKFWFIALMVGVAAGAAAVAFRNGIIALQSFLYQTEDVHHLHSHAQHLPWISVFILPVIGGLLVGLILHKYTPDGRVRSVADVIEGAAMYDGRVERRAGLASAVASLITLSSGGSSGREGPVVHLAAVISTKVSGWLKADGITGRDLLGCAVAAAVSASFNAPIAGALFALEVVLRHFAVHALAPIVIASVAGTVVSRMWFGDVAEYSDVTPGALQFYVELPAFLLLGLLSGVVAVILMKSIFFTESLADHIQEQTGLPRWLRPAFAGALLGLLAIAFPHIIGVGYETTRKALLGDITLGTAVIFAVIKVIATTITMAGRMGGGVFSPAIMTGALTGLAFGYIATALFPDVSGNHALYAFAGMGAVAAAVLGAPISTTLIVFELTGDWQIGLAVMVSVSLSTALASRLVDRSFFLTQLERRNRHVAAGPQAYLLAMVHVGAILRPLTDPRAPDMTICQQMVDEGLFLQSNATLESALPLFERSDAMFLPVVQSSAGGEVELIGVVFHMDALKSYNRALADTAAEEHS